MDSIVVCCLVEGIFILAQNAEPPNRLATRPGCFPYLSAVEDPEQEQAVKKLSKWGMECLLGLMLIIVPGRNYFSVNLQIHFLQQEERD